MTKQPSIYLDYAAATPVLDQVAEVMKPYLSDQFYNPSAVYLAAQQVRRQVDEARRSVASHLGARADEIIFTAGATESCNLAITGVMSNFPDSNMLISSIEHSAVMKPAQKYDSGTVAVDSSGKLDLSDLRQKITDNTVLVSVILANNEIGVIQDLSEIAKIIQEVRESRRNSSNKPPIYLHTDAAQAGNYLDLHVSRLGVDLLTLNGGKMYGPKQSGILYVRGGVKIEPQILGGGQEFGLRSGTENVANIIGFAESLSLAQQDRKLESHRLAILQKHLTKKLESLDIKGLVINGSLKDRLPNNVNFSIPGKDGERLVMALDEVGIQCATGAACSANEDASSHVIKALGYDESHAQGSIRISFGRSTTEADINQFIDRFQQICD